MSNKVYTYSNISELKNAPFYKDILTIPQIAMSKEMSAIRFKMPAIGKNILSFSFFQQGLIPEWNSSGQRFKYVTILNQFIRGKLVTAKDKYEKEWLYGCKKNINVAISNIIRFEEAFVKPEDITDIDKDMVLFKEMWQEVLEKDGSIADFRGRREELKDENIFTEAVENVFGRYKIRQHGKKEIILNGFQYFTPIQRFVFECFENAGFDIYALIQDDKRYPYANEIWNHLYSKENGFPEKDKWIRQISNSINPLGEIFETGNMTSAPNVKVIKYKNTIEFVEDIKRIREEGFYLYSSDDKAANDLLRDYYPENYEIRNLLAYPIGQFVYTLHKMWDENLQSVALSPDGLRKCFASGWLSYKGRSSIKYTDDLERMLPYFNNCYKLEEWQERINRFGDAFDEAIDVFKDENGDKNTVRKKEILGNPFSNFGVFSVNEAREDAVIGIIAELIKMAKTLFGKNEPISIQKHMSNLDALLYMNDGMPPELFQKEKETVKRIFEALESDRVKDFMCYPGDLAAAMLFFMGDKLEDDKEKKDRPGVLVFNLFQVESAPIASKGKVHICMADIQKLPGSAGKYSWPLDEDLLNRIYSKTNNHYVSEWIDNNKLISLYNRFYTYVAMQNNDVEISWIERQGDKLYSPSPYITLLDKLSDSKIKESDIRDIDLLHVTGVQSTKKLDKEFDITRTDNKYPYEAELEYALCPMRFVYGYVLDKSPSYRGEFQQNRAIVRLIQVLNVILNGKYSVEQIADQLFEVFPGIRKAEMRQMIDDAKSWNLPYNEDSYTTFEGNRYSDYRINLKFLDRDVYNAAKRCADVLFSQKGRRGISYENIGDDGEKNCMFCPHASYCVSSLFGVDYRDDGK